MKKQATLAVLALLAGCASAPTHGPGINDLRDPQYLRAERKIPMTFAKIQMALFEHQKTCGAGPEFRRDQSSPSYASIVQKLEPSAQWDRTILVDLVLLQNAPVRATAYSYYAGNDDRIRQVFDAVLHPQQCPQ